MTTANSDNRRPGPGPVPSPKADSDLSAVAPSGIDGDHALVGPVHPARLMARASASRFNPGRFLTGASTASAARSVLTRLLGRMSRDTLTIIDVNGRTLQFGGHEPTVATKPLSATITVTDDRAWTAVLREGSIGLGRGFIEGWWTSEEPTAAVQILIRNLTGLDDLRNRVNRTTGRFGDAARLALPRSSKARNREDIGAHYDLGNDFFRMFLDETMTYSSAVFTKGNTGGATDGPADLGQASLAKYDRLLSKLRVTADHDVLEIGTGWGGMALRAAEERGASVTTTTVSDRQFEEASIRVEQSSAADRVTLLNRDWRELRGTFDRIVSIEMIEAVDWREYNRFFATIERCLSSDGMVGIQAICVPDRRYDRTKNTEDFIRRFVFPGGFLPSIGAITKSLSRSTRLQLLDVEDFSFHYANTLRLWRQQFETRRSDIVALGLDDRFCRLWRFYLSYCEAGFLERHCTVNQFVLVGPDWRPDGLELRPV